MSECADYWNGPGARKTFTHPLTIEWLANLPFDTTVLDYGCGYGRCLAELRHLGFTDLLGVDPSPALIARGRWEHPDLDLQILDSQLQLAAGAYGLVLLIAVLTCVPDSAEQTRVMQQVKSSLRPGGLLYVSDVLIQSDERNQQRYLKYAAATAADYGTFQSDDGALLRHHKESRLWELLQGLDIVHRAILDMPTMNGHTVRAVQILARNPQ